MLYNPTITTTAIWILGIMTFVVPFIIIVMDDRAWHQKDQAH